MLDQEEVKRYNLLFKEFQQFLTRPLTKKEKDFIKWIVKNDMSIEHRSSANAT
ncbi:hypothetical protein QUF84_16725 [Fictibacillus enclensis]|jgi:hypothetical protein|uniref:Uncharacterized protein n=2 Tax=Fictibacillus TaxID=1329200 RepID=A0A1G9W677_9BACL|nr:MULTISPECIES: hypothetical protein [Fictibacillus]MDM5199621.1 hypothetical protein [Fictibacillus enclensis]MDM5338860.1 hypothetical protein [Fictibacillus enclensis]MDN4525234.1 hypothetical protein [Fictibacillus sp. NE201]WHY70351.1 hypothetical protein QNH15_14860 [Fictibacillus enclensis]SCC00767.1 hypothetical protein GA0061096_1955 [Fictibacillus enclensis]